METLHGKIKSVSFGRGGYQGCQFGLWLSCGGDGWGASADCKEAVWDYSFHSDPVKSGCQWTEDDRTSRVAKLCRKVSELLNEAKVDSVEKLKGKPVEVVFNGGGLHSWRILTEVL